MQLSDFAELEAPVECTARVTGEPEDGRVGIALAMHQLDSPIGDARVELDFVSLFVPARQAVPWGRRPSPRTLSPRPSAGPCGTCGGGVTRLSAEDCRAWRRHGICRAGVRRPTSSRAMESSVVGPAREGSVAGS